MSANLIPIISYGGFTTTSNVTGGNLIATGNIVLTGSLIGSGASPAPSINSFQSGSFIGNITAGNLVTGGRVVATGNVTGNYLFGNASQLTAVNATTVDITDTNGLTTIYYPTFVENRTTGQITRADTDLSYRTDNNTLTVGNISTGNVTAQNLTGNINITGNVIGTSANVDLVAGSYEWSFDNTGNLTLPGNTFAVNYANNTQIDIVTKFEGSWTAPVGNSTQSFTVDANETYQMWVSCNIPNGIIAWNAIATITNTNVPVVGDQYAWVYNAAGTPIDFTSIPNQFVGTSNTIVRSSTSPSITTNRFDFGINNTSGSPQTVRYGWIRIS
jgi:hypothetical protein